jgi:hypothetical protein
MGGMSELTPSTIGATRSCRIGGIGRGMDGGDEFDNELVMMEDGM